MGRPMIASMPMKIQIPSSLRTVVTLKSIPDGIAGIKATLAVMVRYAQQSRYDFAVRNQALKLVAALPSKNYMAEVEAIHKYVRDDVRYVKDIDGVETVATPTQTMLMMQGDCDDKALLAAALLMAIGHQVRFVAVGDSPDNISHVLIETMVGRRWWPVETTEPVAVGWYPDTLPFRLVYYVPPAR